MNRLRACVMVVMACAAIGCESSSTPTPDTGVAPDTGVVSDSPLPVRDTGVDLGAPIDVPPAPDAPPPVDLPPAADVPFSCTLPGGGTCMAGQSCPHPDGCNTCTCYDLSGVATCTTLGCPTDGGAPRDAGPMPDAAMCGGASIAPSGYCAGPADGPLPPSCCTNWPCDVRATSCDRIPPTCAAGEVPTAVMGCYGPCVPVDRCAPINCADGTCPSGWTCNTATHVCRFGA